MSKYINKLEQIVLASSNLGKSKEIQTAFNAFNLNIKIINQSELNISSCEEPYNSFIENALIKARHASKQSNLPALADDSGLCIPYIDNLPGVSSAHWADDNNFAQDIPNKDKRNNLYLEYQLKNNLLTIEQRKAYYYCVLVFIHQAQDPCPIIVYEKFQGILQLDARGTKGFGYDPYFYIPSLNKTAAELDILEKNKISHRGKAIKKLIYELKDI